MANEIENALKNTAKSVENYVKDAVELRVVTQYVEIGPDGTSDFDKAKPVARTVIKLDGDSETIIPTRKTEAGPMEVESALFDLHQENVSAAIEYRARILNALLGTLLSRV